MADRDTVLQMRREVEQIYISDEVLEYILRLMEATRQHSRILQGGSPRATLALAAMSRAAAYGAGRDFVTPREVQAVFTDVTAHRLIWTPDASAYGARSRVLLEILQKVAAPQMR